MSGIDGKVVCQSAHRPAARLISLPRRRANPRQRHADRYPLGWTRHPVDRLWSAWQSKLLLREPLFVELYGTALVPRSPKELPEGRRRWWARRTTPALDSHCRGLRKLRCRSGPGPAASHSRPALGTTELLASPRSISILRDWAHRGGRGDPRPTRTPLAGTRLAGDARPETAQRHAAAARSHPRSDCCCD